MRSVGLFVVFLCWGFYSIAFDAAGATGDDSKLTAVFPGATIRLQANMVIEPVRDTSFTGATRASRSVRIPVSLGSSEPPGYWAEFDRIRHRRQSTVLSDVTAFARYLRRSHKKYGYKKITVRARPSQKAVEETYYKPASDEWITSKILVLDTKSFIQGFHTVSNQARGTSGAQALRKVVLSLAPARR